MLFLSETHRIFSQKVMRTFGWDPSDEDLKDMVNVIDQVDITLYLLHIKLYLFQFVFVFEGHGQCYSSGGQNVVITANQVSDALVSLDFICESISNNLKLLP